MFNWVRKYLYGYTTKVGELREQIEAEYHKIQKKKSTKKVTVTPEGGTVLLSGCRIRIPAGALRKKKTFKLTLCRDFEFLADHIPISPVLSCDPVVTFERSVTVSIETAYVPLSQNSTPTFIYRKTKHCTSKEQGPKLQNDCRVEFDTKYLDTHVLAIDVNKTVLFQMLSHVYIHKETALVVSFLCWGDMMLESFTKALENNGFHHYMSLRKYPKFRFGYNVEMRIAFKAPKPRMLFTKDQQKFDVNKAFLKSSDVRSVFYKIDPLLDDYEGPIKMEYTITSSEKGNMKFKITAPLQKEWKSLQIIKEATAAAEISRPPEEQISSNHVGTRKATAIGNSIAAAGDVIIQNGSHTTIIGALFFLLIALTLASIYYNVHLLQHYIGPSSRS